MFFFCFRFENSILWQLLILDHNALDKREKNILRHYLFGNKTIQNCLKIDETHWYDNNSLQRQKTKKKKRVHILEADIITIKTNIQTNINVSSSKVAFFIGCIPNDCHCACLSKNHYHINRLYLIWDTLYIAFLVRQFPSKEQIFRFMLICEHACVSMCID